MAAGAETEQAVEWALEAGYRHIDTASMYRNEQSVGAALRRSGLPREQVFVTTKLMPTQPSAARELAKSLERLSLDYVDLYLIHWPRPLRSARLWRQLESLQERGLAREIGVSNFGRDRLGTLLRGGSRMPAVDQVQFSPFHYRRRLLDYCLERGIVFEAYSPLERGQRLKDPTISALAERLGRTPAQVMLRWQSNIRPSSSPNPYTRSASVPMPSCSTSSSPTATCESSTRSTAQTAARGLAARVTLAPRQARPSPDATRWCRAGGVTSASSPTSSRC
jgi:diketogulonate reductase-like aldo/keto reductase